MYDMIGINKVNFEIPEQVDYVLEVLENFGYKAYVVGGAIRSILFNKIHDTNYPIKDWDIATSAKPDDVKRIFKKVIPTGEKHGTVTVMMSDCEDNGESVMAIEVTTFRTDGNYSDNRRPDEVEFIDDIKEDLARRDFTMNAIAVDRNLNIIDPFNGVQDIIMKLITTVGNPEDRFKEDALRIMRSIRFASQLGCATGYETMMAIISHSHLLKHVSVERIREELCKILVSDNVTKGLGQLAIAGVFAYIVPELQNCMLFEQKNPHHHKDVFGHIVDVVEKTENDLILRLSALFHDIAKPVTFTCGDDNIGHFYGHHTEGYFMTLDIMNRLKFDGDTRDRVASLVREHMTYFKEMKKSSVKRLIGRLGQEDLDRLFKLQRADTLAHVITEYTDDRLRMVDEAERLAREIIKEQEALSLKDLKINGNDLMLHFDIPQGKLIGETLNHLFELVLEDNSLNDNIKLLELSDNYLKGKYNS